MDTTNKVDLINLNFPAIVSFGQADESDDDLENLTLVNDFSELLKFLKDNLVVDVTSEFIDIDTAFNNDLERVVHLVMGFHEINDDLEDGDNYRLVIKSLCELKTVEK